MRELVEFLGRRFDAIDQRFDAMDRRFEAMDERLTSIEERLSRVEVRGEQNRHYIELVAEGVAALDRKLDGFRTEVEERFRWVDRRFTWVGERFLEMDERFDAVDRRFDRMDGRFDGQGEATRSALELLAGRLSRLESRLN